MLYLYDTGLITAIGGNTETTISAIKASINRYSDTLFYNKLFKSIVMSLVPNDALPDLSQKLHKFSSLTTRQTRLLRLATPALKESLKKWPDDKPIPLFLAGSESVSDVPPALHSSFIEHLAIQSNIKLDLDNSRIISTGRSAGIEAIKHASSYLEQSGQHAVLVGGVDTYQDLFLLATLDQENRIKFEGSDNSFVPGEGAGFLLLISETARKHFSQIEMTAISQPGIGIEAGHLYSDSAYKGDGLANAFRNALTHVQHGSVSGIYSSLNGENFSTKELGVAITRNSQYFMPGNQTYHPADCFGDIGAATGPALIILANSNLLNDKSNLPSLVYCSSDTGPRAAVCIHA